MKPILSHARDHRHVTSPFCGDLVEVLRNGGTAPDIAVLVNVTHTKAHFHRGFDEVYFVLDGSMSVRLYDPSSDVISEHSLARHEVCVIPQGVHHVILQASVSNRLAVLCMPRFDGNDEVASDRL